MSFETRLMAPGRFDVRLVDDTPEHIAALTDNYLAAVLVMPGPIFNPAKVPLATLLADAVYVGVHTARPDRRLGFGGYGPAHLLRLAVSPEDQVVSKCPVYNGSSTSWLRNNVLRVGVSESQGLVAGPITVAGGGASPTKGGRIRTGQEPLEIVGDVARRFGLEWDVRDGNKVEVAARADLFRVTPSVAAVPRGSGGSLVLEGLEAAEFSTVDDWDDFATTVAVPFDPPDFEFGETYEVGDTVVASDGTFYECTSAHTSSGANLPPSSKWTAVDTYGEATGSTSYTDPFTGGAIVARRVEQARNAITFDDATDIATARLGRFDEPRRDVTLDTATFDLSGKVRAGDNIWAFSPEHDLVDTANQVMWQGRPLPMVKVRAQWVRTNVDPSMSVLVVVGGGAPLDVSPWVLWEGEGQVVGLGQPRRRLRVAALRASGVSPGVVGSV